MNPPFVDPITADIQREEGWNAHVYRDTRKFWTIGYGFLVDPRRGTGMPREVGDFWLKLIVDRLLVEIPSRWRHFDQQPAQVQRALVQMAYQLGVDGLMGFKLMLTCLERGDREGAAENALASQWYRQTPARAERVAKLIRGY